MTKHQFGGDWTTDKLERIRKYLCAYTTIFTKNPKARYFTTIYVDAFAGTGHRVGPTKRAGKAAASPETADPKAGSFRKGSACIALVLCQRCFEGLNRAFLSSGGWFAEAKVNWRFGTPDARIKPRKLYPSFDG